MPPCLVFDLDGTLVDSRTDLVASVRAMLAAQGHPDRPAGEIAGFIGRGARYLVAQSLPEAARDEASVDAALAWFRTHYAAHLADTTTAYPGIPEALAALAEGARLSVLTNKPGDMARALLDDLGLAAHFHEILGAGDVPAHKPDPGGLRRALEGCDDPAAAWYVGDLPLDVETARGAGCRVASVLWGFSAAADLQAASPDRVIAAPPGLVDLVGVS